MSLRGILEMVKVHALILFMLILVGCLPQQQARIPLSSEAQSSSVNTETESTSSENTSNTSVQWFHQSTYNTTLTLDATNKQNGFLRGDDVDSFLQTEGAFDANYCLVINFQESSVYDIKQLRVKVIPNQFTDYMTGSSRKYFRVNFVTSDGNEICDVDIAKTDPTTGNETYESRPSNLVLATEDVCPDCINFITSSSVKLYQVDTSKSTSYLKVVSDNDIKTDPLIFRIDMNNYASSNSGTCTNNSCQSLGFDCCVAGQCVNEKAQKSAGIAADPTGFQLAEVLKYSDPFWYLKYPQFYYSCLENPGTPEEELNPPLDPDKPDEEADERLNALISDYECINELVEKSEASPFHRDPITSGASYTKCSLTASNDNYYQSVMTRMYQNCGCVETEFSQMVENCPAYTYKVVYKKDNSNNDTDEIENIVCQSPEPESEPVPFQNLEVSVSARSAPHRFFNKDNVELDPTVPLEDGVSETQEGDTFMYLDSEKIFPLNGSFNMNSLLGQMKTTLDQARPAKVVNVEFDKVYFIAALSGYYTPCPNCAKDSWFNNFSANPVTTQGLGLQAVGHTTKRDNWGSNYTLGNYEDTIFGRACWLPPTMLPYSHSPNSDVQEQRLNRLQTQAAMYMNGYQRDWFGFNKGALIGSFDGVTWFAIGKGRIIKSTSQKLFLAINAPFADLALTTDHIVSVQEYDFISSGTLYDYDPNFSMNSPYQNVGGQCQVHHKCESDSDCVTTLGWEYVCSDVYAMKSKWPVFNTSDASEVANDAKEKNIVSILAQAELPAGETKRCIYRGAGAPCRIDYENIDEENLRKSLTCAPNFYCADVTLPNAFNKEVARFGAPLESLVESNNHYFGQDANILGRPKDYANNDGLYALPQDVQDTISENLLIQDENASGKVGLCRPGKKLPSASGSSTNDWEPSSQHADFDSENRTDYISQIASCNSNLRTNLRYSSCPVFDTMGNYIHLQDDYVDANFSAFSYLKDVEISLSKSGALNMFATAQNSCGLESLKDGTSYTSGETADEIQENSPFKAIEGKPLGSGQLLSEQTLVRDACLRKAGTFCHTDLDCSPNRLIAEQASLYDDSYFGNLAERKYFEEYLICGQGEAEPYPGQDGYDTYSVKNNRCCREVGKDLTMYSEGITGVDESTNLRTDKFGGFFPTDPNRYSRYSSLEVGIDSDGTASTRFIAPISSKKSFDDGASTIASFQWKTIHRTAQKTCCGGGWIRKFADGTNNWGYNRLRLEPENFRCLNSLTPLADTKNPEAYGTTQRLLDNDRRNTMCVDTSFQTGGCPMWEISSDDDPGVITRPKLVNGTFSDGDGTAVGARKLQRLRTDGTTMDWTANLFTFSVPQSIDSNTVQFLNWSLNFTDPGVRRNVSIYLPSWVAYDNFDTDVDVRLEYSGGIHTCSKSLATTPQITGPMDMFLNDGSCGTQCCYEYDETTRSLRVSHRATNASGTQVTSGDTNAPNNTNNYADGGNANNYSLVLDFYAPGTLLWEQKFAGGATDNSTIDHRRASEPGNMNYYLDRFERLELIGIPQMTYPPIYCNSNYQKLVPGIFKEDTTEGGATNVNEFVASAYTFEDDDQDDPWQDDLVGGPTDASSVMTSHVATEEMLDLEPIFSSHEFKCCLKLGSTTTDTNSCCSGYGVQSDGGNTSDSYTCMLAPGTDLNVYFNRFVSGEGLNDEDSESITETLEEEDFDPKTGNPKSTSEVLTKLKLLGSQYCPSGATVRGGAFGAYPAEINGSGPSQNSETFNIVDSSYDQAQTSTGEARGYVPYSQGFRWNHHIYCTLGDGN